MLPADTPRLPLFLCVYLGLFVPIICIQIFGAATQLAAFSVPSWEAASKIGAPNLLFTMSGGGAPAKFVMVLFCLSTVANVAPTIYSCGLSGQIFLPFLVKVPRYFLALLVTAIYLPIAIVGSTHFFLVLENFLAVLGYWTSLYLPPALIEPIFFRRPVNLLSYPVEIWNKPSKLPIGLAFIAAACVVSFGHLRKLTRREFLSAPLVCPRRGGTVGSRVRLEEVVISASSWALPLSLSYSSHCDTSSASTLSGSGMYNTGTHRCLLSLFIFLWLCMSCTLQVRLCTIIEGAMHYQVYLLSPCHYHPFHGTQTSATSSLSPSTT